MTLKLMRLPGRFRRGGGGSGQQLPNASDDSKTSTETLSSGTSSSSSSSVSYQPRPPLPVIIASSVTLSTANTVPSDTSADPSVASLPPPPSATLPHLPNLATTSTIIAHGTQPPATAGRRLSWRSASIGSMRSIDEDAEFPASCSDDDLDLWGNNIKQNVADDSAEKAMLPGSRYPLLSYRAPSNPSLTNISSSCPATTASPSSSPSKREVREEKIRRKNFEARRREFATVNPRRLSDDGRSVGSAASSTCSGEDPRLIRRRRQSVDFLREESQAAAMNGDADDGCYYCHHGKRCLENYRPRPSRSSSLDDSSDQRRHAEHAPTGHRRRATMPFDTTCASPTLIGSYYVEQDDTWNDSSSTCSSDCPCQQSSTTITATSDTHVRRTSMPISITEDESDDECKVGNSSSHSNWNGSRNGGNIGLLEDLEGRGPLLYYKNEHRSLSL